MLTQDSKSHPRFDWELWNPPTRQQRRMLIRESEERQRMDEELAQVLDDEWHFAAQVYCRAAA